MSRRKVSLALGKDSHFLSVHVRRVANPSTKLVRDVADACGYEMLFRGHDEEILVVPPITDDDMLIGGDKKEDEND